MQATLSFLELWFEALHEPIGIVVQTTNRTVLMNRLYKARSEYQSPEDLAGLSIVMSPVSDKELWIIHKVVKVVKEPEGGEG